MAHLLLDEAHVVVVPEDAEGRGDVEDLDVRVGQRQEALHQVAHALGRVVRRVGLLVSWLARARDEHIEGG